MLRCSFCQNNGHNIKKCPSHSLTIMENILRIYKNKYSDVRYYINWIFYKIINPDNEPDDFLYDFKGYAVRFCKSKINGSHWHEVCSGVGKQFLLKRNAVECERAENHG